MLSCHPRACGCSVNRVWKAGGARSSGRWGRKRCGGGREAEAGVGLVAGGEEAGLVGGDDGVAAVQEIDQRVGRNFSGDHGLLGFCQEVADAADEHPDVLQVLAAALSEVSSIGNLGFMQGDGAHQAVTVIVILQRHG